jgi:hypothetical protein
MRRNWLAAGANPEKALRFARMNVDVRKTPRACGLLAEYIGATIRTALNKWHKRDQL